MGIGIGMGMGMGMGNSLNMGGKVRILSIYLLSVYMPKKSDNLIESQVIRRVMSC